MHDVLAITHNGHIIRHDHVKYDVIIAYMHILIAMIVSTWL